MTLDSAVGLYNGTNTAANEVRKFKGKYLYFYLQEVDAMFHKESRFQTERQNKRRGDTSKCPVGKGQTAGERGSMATVMYMWD